jgi:hypothetical protein
MAKKGGWLTKGVVDLNIIRSLNNNITKLLNLFFVYLTLKRHIS